MTHLYLIPGKVGLSDEKFDDLLVLDGDICSLEPALAVGLTSWARDTAVCAGCGADLR